MEVRFVIEGIRAISFDGDGTLWDFDHVMRHSLRCVLAELTRLDQPSAARLNVDTMIEIRNDVAAHLKGTVTNLEQVRLEAFRQTLRAVGRPNDALAEQLNQIYLQHRFEDIELYDDVLPTLNALKRTYRIGLLSNGNSYPERCGLDNLFEFVIFSQDHGVEKPNPRIFQIVLDHVGCAHEELLHVGDSLDTDVQGARNARVPCVWVNRSYRSPPLNMRNVCTITTLRDLLTLL
jgi:putative hydrolase of the HAD superfamily